MKENNNLDDIDANLYFVVAAKYGRVIDSRIAHVNWTRTRVRWIKQASCIPAAWFAPNNYVHEATFWFDGTALYDFHGTKVGMYFCVCSESCLSKK